MRSTPRPGSVIEPGAVRDTRIAHVSPLTTPGRPARASCRSSRDGRASCCAGRDRGRGDPRRRRRPAARRRRAVQRARPDAALDYARRLRRARPSATRTTSASRCASTSRSRARRPAGRGSSTTRTSTARATSTPACGLARELLLEVLRARPAGRLRVPRPDHAAVHLRHGRLGRDRRAHDREPDPPPARLGPVDAGRLQEPHRRQRPGRRRRRPRRRRAARLRRRRRQRHAGDPAHDRQPRLPRHPARRLGRAQLRRRPASRPRWRSCATPGSPSGSSSTLARQQRQGPRRASRPWPREIGEQVAARQPGDRRRDARVLPRRRAPGRRGGHELDYGQSITDACMDWDATVGVLDGLAAAVRARAPPRLAAVAMRVALVGVGLIGGSIGLAARERARARTSSASTAARRRSSSPSSAARSTRPPAAIAEAIGGGRHRDRRASPVDALPAHGRGRSARRCPDARRHRRRLDEGGARRAPIDDERFIGGHPLAGAETAGVEHARADLFDGATWYLTPRERTAGVLYERLAPLRRRDRRRPHGDRRPTTTTGSWPPSRHLPHVVANVLVAQAGRARSAASGCPRPARASATPRAWPGANPRALGARSTSPTATRSADADRRSRARGCARCARCSTPATATARRLARRRRASSAARCCEAASPAARRVRELRVVVPNQPGRRRRRSRSRSAARASTSPTCRSRPTADNAHRHDRRCGSPATSRRAARRARSRELGYPAASRVTTVRFAPSGPLRGDRQSRRRTSRSRTARRCSARCRASRCASPTTCAPQDTLSTLDGDARARRAVEERDDGDGRRARRGPARARASPAGRSTSATPARCMRLLPGWLAAQAGRIFDARRRRLDPPPAGRPDRRAAAR